jgi:hypothetical protein
MTDTDMREARARVQLLQQSLPKSVSAADLGVWSKAPFQFLCTREALIWRTEELARGCCDAVDRNDYAIAALLARATIENAALAWKLMEVLDERKKYPPQELIDLLGSMLVGSRIWDDMPKALQILTCINRMDKTVSGIRKSYDILSEIAHPNWGGVFGMYSKTDQAMFTTYFGRGLRPTDGRQGQIINSLIGALQVFEYAYNRISDLMPDFIADLDKIWPDT